MAKLTCEKLKYFIADEKKGSAEYKRYGLPMLSKDENSHRIYLMGKMKEMGCSCKYMKGGYNKQK